MNSMAFGKILAATAAATLLLALIGVPLYVLPAADDHPGRADVLLVLAPTAGRMGYAENLMEQGYADMLAISAPLVEGGKEPAACNERRTYRVLCFNPEPVTTQGEARALGRLSAKYGWKSVDVLTAEFHVTRARVILERCYQGDMSMIAYRQDRPLFAFTGNSWAYIYVYETAAFVKVAANQDC